jgi:hypothetical protein
MLDAVNRGALQAPWEGWAVGGECPIALGNVSEVAMVEAQLHETSGDAIGVCNFIRMPRVGDFVDYRQMQSATLFSVVAIHHVVTDLRRPAEILLIVERVKQSK